MAIVMIRCPMTGQRVSTGSRRPGQRQPHPADQCAARLSRLRWRAVWSILEAELVNDHLEEPDDCLAWTARLAKLMIGNNLARLPSSGTTHYAAVRQIASGWGRGTFDAGAARPKFPCGSARRHCERNVANTFSTQATPRAALRTSRRTAPHRPKPDDAQSRHLDDKYDLTKSRIFVTGYQALVRLTLMQKERDRRAGLNTAGYVTGYRGSPLGGLDQQFMARRAS